MDEVLSSERPHLSMQHCWLFLMAAPLFQQSLSVPVELLAAALHDSACPNLATPGVAACIGLQSPARIKDLLISFTRHLAGLQQSS